MINQIHPIRQAPSESSPFNKEFAKVRRIQAKLQGRIIDSTEMPDGLFWNPLMSGPYLAPITRRI
jgi:hypothetical protein